VDTEKYSPPKYFQISRDVVSLIQSGKLSPGSPVPSENEIIEKYQVSNTTARKALHELEKEGWVNRVKGKGTFVRDFTVVRAINRIFGFTKNMIEAGRKPATKLIGFHLRNADHTQTITGRAFTLKGSRDKEMAGRADTTPAPEGAELRLSIQINSKQPRRCLDAGQLYAPNSLSGLRPFHTKEFHGAGNST
jgi:DNA-binding transcriptional regulator YhcF (GntR family)